MPDPDLRTNPQARRSVDFGQWFSRGLFLAVLIFIGLRPLLQETHDTERQTPAVSLSDLAPIGPLPTLWIDLTITIAFGLTLALCIGGRLPKVRGCGLWPGLLVLASAACASCCYASNKRLAINATFDWITLPMLAISLSCLLQKAWQVRLSLAVIAASGVASAVNSCDQVLWSFPHTVQMYEQHKAEIWGEAANDPNAWQVKQFEKRLREQAATGFFAMTNVAGSYLLLTTFAVLALAAAHRPKSWPFAALAVLAMMMSGALVLTRSRGAIVALMVGFAFLGALRLLDKHITAHRRMAWLAGWLMMLAGLACIGAYGLKHGTLPGGSLTYRWWYLEATARMVRANPWVGVGSEQYGRHFPRYKEIKLSEEVANPHNLLAQAAAEWGLPGMIGMMMLLFGGSWAAAGLSVLRTPNAAAALRLSRSGNGPASSAFNVPLWGIALGGAIWGLRILILGSLDPNYILATNAYPLIGWVVSFLVVVTIPVGTDRVRERVAPTPVASAAALGVGLLAFLIYELINHALFNSGCGTTFFAVLGVCVAAREMRGARQLQRSTDVGGSDFQVGGLGISNPTEVSNKSTPARRVRIAVVLLLTGAAALVSYGLSLSPVLASWKSLTLARGCISENQVDSRNRAAMCHARYEQARLADRLDPTAPKEFCQFALGTAEVWSDPEGAVQARRLLEQAVHMAEHAIQSDPESLTSYRLKAAVLVALFGKSGRTELVKQASAAYEQVLKRYPTNPDDRLRMSEIQELLFEELGQMTYAAGAAAHLEKALGLDASRAPMKSEGIQPPNVRRWTHD